MDSYQTIIAGSRSITEYDCVVDAIESAPFTIETVISGGAKGVDSSGEEWARTNNIPIRKFSPDEFESEASERGIPAPLVRNEKMASAGEALIAVWDGNSRGTQYMISCAESEGIPVYTKIHKPDIHRLDEF